MATREEWMSKLRNADKLAQGGDAQAAADAKKIAARIRELDASGGFGDAGAPAQEPGLLTRAMNAMERSGKATREAVMNPGQAIPDILRSTGDFVSMGGTDRLRSAIYGTPYEQENAETEAAAARSGSIDDALNMGSLLVQPSAAAKYAPQATNALVRGGQKALAHGTEGAALSGANAVIEGNDVLPAMAYGGFGGAGGSIAGDAVGSVANIFSRNKPKYKTDEDFFKDADKARINSDLGKRKVRLERIRMAETKGQPGFKELSDEIERTGPKQMGLPREEVEGISRLGNRSSAKGEMLRELGNLVQGGTAAGQVGSGHEDGRRGSAAGRSPQDGGQQRQQGAGEGDRGAEEHPAQRWREGSAEHVAGKDCRTAQPAGACRDIRREKP